MRVSRIAAALMVSMLAASIAGCTVSGAVTPKDGNVAKQPDPTEEARAAGESENGKAEAMGRKTMERPEQMVLEGVSKIVDGGPQSDGFISGLDNIVQFLGEGNQYHYFLGMSGRGFRALGAPTPEPHEEESSTARTEEIYDFPSVRAAVEATGYDFEMLGNGEGPLPYGFDAFTSSVDRSIPDIDRLRMRSHRGSRFH